MVKEFIAKPNSNLRHNVEQAQVIARAMNSNIIIVMNNVRFSVGPDTKMQEAIDTYMEVKRKMFETEQKLKQKTRI